MGKVHHGQHCPWVVSCQDHAGGFHRYVGSGGVRKDTVTVRPNQTVTVVFDADNPGQWLAHCNNAYHAERGMMAFFSYAK
ncbi:multicopper oxidase domain-containing protein [Arthrobacter glacialis]|uniref:Plastocyanin-like domain-containing protein n=1 Tax=Arthrobacter glacialis TaxID=1664 RepID=A0A2S3ZUA7_ARTGL|nr:hypothetical protein CVS27_15265 [Arthrobacter glacialis]